MSNNNEYQEKENRITNYIKSLSTIEEAMDAYKEQQRALKGNYVVKDDTDVDQLLDFYSHVQKTCK